MLVQALLAGLVVGLSKMEYFFGYSMFNRPIVEGAIMGLVLGDPVTGTIIGATLEIVFLGSFPVGAAVSPDGGTAAGVSTAFAILTGAGTAVGTAFAVPLALLGGFAFVLCKFINNAFAEAMKAQLAKDNDKAARALFWAGSWVGTFGLYFLIGFLSVFFGSTALESAVSAIPADVINGIRRQPASCRGLCPAAVHDYGQEACSLVLYRIHPRCLPAAPRNRSNRSGHCRRRAHPGEPQREPRYFYC